MYKFSAGSIERGNGIPLYRQVYEILRARIVDGSLATGAQLPTEQSLAADLKVSTITCRRAMQELAAAGYIQRTPRRGSIVQPVPFSAPISASFEELLGTVGLKNWHSEPIIDEFSYVTIPEELREIVGAGAGAVFQKVVTITVRQDLAVAHLTTWVPEDIGKHFTIEDIRNTPRLELLRRGGIQVARAVQTIGACALPNPIAKVLQAPPKSPGVRMTRTVEDRFGRLVEYIEAYSPWDRYEYRIVME